MSFSTDVKEDILKLNTDDSMHFVEAEALLRFGSEIILGNPKRIHFSTSNMAVLRFFVRRLKEIYKDLHYELFSRQMQKLQRTTIFSCMIDAPVEAILKDFDLLSEHSSKKQEILSEPGLMKAYLRGAFLVKGTVNPPETSNYHLEMVTDTDYEALFLQKCMNYFELNARITKRRNHLIVYLKEKDSIIDFLRHIGANVMMNEFENIVIRRGLAANVNRLMNIDVANQQKTNQSSKEQLKYIRYLERYYPLEKLDDKLLLVMTVRKENPEASLNEMVEIINQSYHTEITKSGLNHRLRHLKEIAKKEG